MTSSSVRSPSPTAVAISGETLAAALRRMASDRSWSQARGLCTSGKVTVNGARVVDPALRLRGGETVSVTMNAPRPEKPGTTVPVLFEDAHVIVIDKPEGVSSVPYDKLDKGTALDLIRATWKRQGRRATASALYTVHRLDKETSGILCFAKTKPGERGLHRIFKGHLADREYVAVIHGAIEPGRIGSYLIPDRGDGIRGSTRLAGEGQLSVTHVVTAEPVGGRWRPELTPTLIRLRLETGRTHQIRIHMAEAGRFDAARPSHGHGSDVRGSPRSPGHPVIGEEVYIRDFRASGCTPIDCPRLMLHARTLGFAHPVTGEALSFESPLPASFEMALAGLRRGS